MEHPSALPNDFMATGFNLGDTTMYVGALLKGRGLVASERPVAPVLIRLHVYEFCHGGLGLACPPEFNDFRVYLGQLEDPLARNRMILGILSNTRYNDPDIQRFWREKLNEYVSNIGLNAFNGGVVEPELNVVIYIHNAARQSHEAARRVQEIAAFLMRDSDDEEIDEFLQEHSDDEVIVEEFGGVPASEASIKELEVVKYNGVGGEFAENRCSICLEEFEFETEVTRMPCKHVFHGGCLTQWLETSGLCPICRYEMPIESESHGEELD